MEHWIQNYILQKQIKYPCISESPWLTLSHLFFCIGNGCEIEGGNFYHEMQYGSQVPYEVYYKESWSREECIEWVFDRTQEQEVQRIYDNHRRMDEVLGESEDETYRKAVEQFQSQYDNVDFVDNYSLRDLIDPNTYVDTMMKSKYAPCLHISKGYFKAEKFTEYTDTVLAEVCLAMIVAYKRVVGSMLHEGLWGEWKNPYSTNPFEKGGMSSTLEGFLRNDLEVLKETEAKLRLLVY